MVMSGHVPRHWNEATLAFKADLYKNEATLAFKADLY